MEMRFTDSRPPVPTDSSQGLRPLGWSELCARLVAAHDTRGALAGSSAGQAVDPGPDGGAARPRAGAGFSFHDSAAALLQSVEVQTEELVNPASSAIGNDAEGTEGSVPNAARKRRPDENCHD